MPLIIHYVVEKKINIVEVPAEAFVRFPLGFLLPF